jgi:hypothetical protein
MQRRTFGPFFSSAFIAVALLALPLTLPGRAQASTLPIANFGQLIDSINHTQDTNAYLQTLIPPSPIIPPTPIIPPNPIDAATLLQGNNVSALDNAVSRNSGDVAQMQSLLGQITVSSGSPDCTACQQPLSSYLASQNLSLNQIVAIGIPPNPISQAGQPLELVFQASAPTNG